jgi:GNAT superfamily N-acetyltransferase
VILRHARDDAEQFESFDLGASGSWLDEVAEIIAGLVAWRSDPHAEHRDRQVIVAVTDSHVVGVTAHERLARSGGRVWNDHRYLMVTAVRGDQQRTGLARLLVESVLADLRSRGVSRWSGWWIRRIVPRSSSAGMCSPKPTKHSRPRTTRT